MACHGSGKAIQSFGHDSALHGVLLSVASSSSYAVLKWRLQRRIRSGNGDKKGQSSSD
jgi:hypothetical protein